MESKTMLKITEDFTQENGVDVLLFMPPSRSKTPGCYNKEILKDGKRKAGWLGNLGPEVSHTAVGSLGFLYASHIQLDVDMAIQKL